jgi:hypothetical protein
MVNFIIGFIVGCIISLIIFYGYMKRIFTGYLHLDLMEGKVGLRMTDYPREGYGFALFKIESQKNSSPI